MGMTKVFYMVKKNQLTSEKIHEKMLGASALGVPSYTVFYKETIDWLPVFDPYHCEGQYNADEEFMVSLEDSFGSPVIALAVFDSDVAFVSICENGGIHRYIYADEATLEEFGFEEYAHVIPVELENYVDGKELQRIWSEKYVFAEDLLQNMARLLNTFLVITQLLNTFLTFDEDDIGEDTEIINC